MREISLLFVLLTVTEWWACFLTLTTNPSSPLKLRELPEKMFISRQVKKVANEEETKLAIKNQTS